MADIETILPEKIASVELTQITLNGPAAGTNTGNISRSIRLQATGEYDRIWLSWLDADSRHRVATGFHERNVVDDAYHDAYEIKTSADPLGASPSDMVTRVSIGTDADLVVVDVNAVSRVKFRDDAADLFDFDLTGNGSFEIGDGSAVATEIKYSGDRARVGFDGGDAYIQGGTNRGVKLKANNGTVTAWFDHDGTTYRTYLYNLPTSDPGVANQLWNNGGVLTVSAG